MKKFLFSIVALAMALAANAQTTFSCTTATEEFEGETYKNVTVVLDNKNEATAFQFGFKLDDNSWIDAVINCEDGPLVEQVTANRKKVDVYITGYSETSNVGTPIYYCYYNTAAGNTPKVIANGNLFTLSLKKEAVGNLVISGKVSDVGAVSYTLPEVTVDLSAISTGIENVSVETLKNGKFMENNQIVIVKNGKKFNAAGAQLK